MIPTSRALESSDEGFVPICACLPGFNHIPIFTQGDFVSYTWPALLDQARNPAKATVISRFHDFLIGGGILICALAMIVVLSVI